MVLFDLVCIAGKNPHYLRYVQRPPKGRDLAIQKCIWITCIFRHLFYNIKQEIRVGRVLLTPPTANASASHIQIQIQIRSTKRIKKREENIRKTENNEKKKGEVQEETMRFMIILTIHVKEESMLEIFT